MAAFRERYACCICALRMAMCQEEMGLRQMDKYQTIALHLLLWM